MQLESLHEEGDALAQKGGELSRKVCMTLVTMHIR